MTTELTPTPEDPTTPETDGEVAARKAQVQHDHDDARVDEWEEESFPASDPPSNY